MHAHTKKKEKLWHIEIITCTTVHAAIHELSHIDTSMYVCVIIGVHS